MDDDESTVDEETGDEPEDNDQDWWADAAAEQASPEPEAEDRPASVYVNGEFAYYAPGNMGLDLPPPIDPFTGAITHPVTGKSIGQVEGFRQTETWPGNLDQQPPRYTYPLPVDPFTRRYVDPYSGEQMGPASGPGVQFAYSDPTWGLLRMAPQAPARQYAGWWRQQPQDSYLWALARALLGR